MSTFGTVYYPKEENSQDSKIMPQQAELRSVTQNGIVLFPNPTESNLNLVLSTLYEGSKITITSLDGKVVLQQKAIFGTNQLDVTLLNKGIYFIEVTNENERFFQTKFVKQ